MVFIEARVRRLLQVLKPGDVRQRLLAGEGARYGSRGRWGWSGAPRPPEEG